MTPEQAQGMLASLAPVGGVVPNHVEPEERIKMLKLLELHLRGDDEVPGYIPRWMREELRTARGSVQVRKAAANIGETRERSDGTYRKTGPKKWVKVKEKPGGGKKDKTEPSGKEKKPDDKGEKKTKKPGEGKTRSMTEREKVNKVATSTIEAMDFVTDVMHRLGNTGIRVSHAQGHEGGYQPTARAAPGAPVTARVGSGDPQGGEGENGEQGAKEKPSGKSGDKGEKKAKKLSRHEQKAVDRIFNRMQEWPSAVKREALDKIAKKNKRVAQAIEDMRKQRTSKGGRVLVKGGRAKAKLTGDELQKELNTIDEDLETSKIWFEPDDD